MDSQLEEIGQQLRRITRTDHNAGGGLMSGKVVPGSTDLEAYTVDVLLTMDDNTEAGDSESVATEGVLLNSVSMNNNGIVLYPADGSDVIVGSVDGPGSKVLIKCSDLVQMGVIIGGSQLIIKDGKIQLNDGSLGGLVILQKVLDNLNALKTYVTGTLQNAITEALTAIGAGGAANGTTGATKFTTDMAGQEINFEDMENKSITHG